MAAGVAAPFGTPQRIFTEAGSFMEQFAPGAFERYLGDVRVLREHDRAALLARVGNGTAELWEEAPLALKVRASLPATGAGRDAAALVADGTLNGWSVRFAVVPPDGDRWTVDEAGHASRTVTRAEIREVSLVTWPAYAAAVAYLESDSGSATPEAAPAAASDEAGATHRENARGRLAAAATETARMRHELYKTALGKDKT